MLLDRFERIVRLMPMFRQRVVPALLQTPPRWVYDADFDLRYHVSRVTAPDPGDLDVVLEMARRAEMTEFDHARPLWGVTLVDGLADGGAALVCRLHHSLADGIGGLQVARLLFDLQEEPADLGPLPPAPDGERPGPFDGVTQSVLHEVGALGGLAVGAVRTAPSLLAGSVLRPLSSGPDGGGDRRLGLPDRPPDQPDRVADHAEQADAPRALGPRGAAVDAQGGGTPLGRHAQRRVPRRGDRRACAATTRSTAPRSAS